MQCPSMHSLVIGGLKSKQRPVEKTDPPQHKCQGHTGEKHGGWEMQVNTKMHFCARQGSRAWSFEILGVSSAATHTVPSFQERGTC